MKVLMEASTQQTKKWKRKKYNQDVLTSCEYLGITLGTQHLLFFHSEKDRQSRFQDLESVMNQGDCTQTRKEEKIPTQ